MSIEPPEDPHVPSLHFPLPWWAECGIALLLSVHPIKFWIQIRLREKYLPMIFITSCTFRALGIENVNSYNQYYILRDRVCEWELNRAHLSTKLSILCKDIHDKFMDALYLSFSYCSPANVYWYRSNFLSKWDRNLQCCYYLLNFVTLVFCTKQGVVVFFRLRTISLI